MTAFRFTQLSAVFVFMATFLLKYPISIKDERSGVELSWNKLEAATWNKALIIDGVEVRHENKTYTIPIGNIIAIIE